MRIGVYGGSFNPCHLMHKQIVISLLEKNIFDRIIILPTGNFYNKKNLLKGEERKKMLELMFKDNSRVIICDYEFKNNLISTYRSLDFLQNLYKGDTLYFIMGSDNILGFDKWKRYEYILDNYNLLIIKRKGINIEDSLERYNKYKGDIILLDLDLLDIQSNIIREYLKNEDYNSVEDSLDVNVLEYIKNKKLYSNSYKEDIIKYESDEEFLKSYSSDDYEKMSITTDITLFGISDIVDDNYRKKPNKSFSILLVKRLTPPFINRYCIPGGFLSLDEKLLDCAKRVLAIEANIDNVYLNQIHTSSDIDRDIRGRILSVSYLGLIDKNIILPSLKENASFFDLSFTSNDNIITINFKNEKEEFKCSVKRVIDEFGVVSFEEYENQYLAFDNLKMIMYSIDYLKNNIGYKDLVFHLLPKYFTLKELQLVYEAILDKKLIDSAFRRTIKDLVLPTNEYKRDGGHRPSRLYQYINYFNKD